MFVFACYYFVMEKDEVCVCGKIHKLLTKEIFVGKNAIEKLLSFVKESGFEKILVFNEDKNQSDFLFSMFEENKIKAEIMTIENVKPTEFFAKNIEPKDVDVVVAVGREELISVAKYFAFSLGLDLIAFPKGNFVDWTFSSFSRLFDGVQFCFYGTTSPIAIFVEEENKANDYQTNYIASKFFTQFDKEFEKLVFRSEHCCRMQDFLNKTLKDYFWGNENQSLFLKNVWTLVRLGQAMTFFGETKYFFGGDKAICDMLQSLHCGDFLELESLALKLAMNSYAVFLKNSQNYNVMNLNLQIKEASTLLKVSSTEVIRRLCDNKILMPNKEVCSRFCNFQPYLKKYFEKTISKMFKIQTSFCLSENVVLKNHLNGEKILHAFAVSASFGKVPTLLSMIEAYGFMDKLLE